MRSILKSRTHYGQRAIFEVQKSPDRHSGFDFSGGNAVTVVIWQHLGRKMGSRGVQMGSESIKKFDLHQKFIEIKIQHAVGQCPSPMGQCASPILIDFGTFLEVPNGSKIIKNRFRKGFGRGQEIDGFQDGQMIDFWSILDPFWDQKNVVSICILQCFVDFGLSAKGTPSRIDL